MSLKHVWIAVLLILSMAGQGMGDIPSINVSCGSQTNGSQCDLGTYFNGSYISSFTVNITDTATLSDPYLINTSGLVGWWRFDDNLTDVSGINNDGLWKGAAGSANFTAAKYNNGTSYDGTTDFIDYGNNESLNLSNFTYRGFIDNVSSSAQIGILTKMNSSGTGWVLNMEDGYIKWYAGIAYIFEGIQTPQKYNNMGNHDWYITYNTSWMSLYVDGIYIDSVAVTQPYTNGGNLVSGRYFNNYDGFYFPGKQDDIKVWNYSFSSTDVQNDRNILLQQLQIRNVANNTYSSLWNSSLSNPLDIPYDNELIRNIIFYIPDSVIINGTIIYDYPNSTNFSVDVNYSTNLLKSTTTIYLNTVSNSTIGFMTPYNGSNIFIISSPNFTNLRITDNSEVVLNYVNGFTYNKTGWNLSYDGTNISLTGDLDTSAYNYIILDYNPQLKSINSGYYGNTAGNSGGNEGELKANDINAKKFNNFSLDWYWYSTWGTSLASNADISTISATGKKVLLRIFFWDNVSLVGKTWSDLQDNNTLLDIAKNSTLSQINTLDSDIYAVVISEEEPTSGTGNQTAYIYGANQIYTTIKNQYPNLKVLQGVHIDSSKLSSTNLSNLSRDGIVDDWYEYLYDTDVNMSYWFDEMKTEQNIHPDTYALIWAGSNYSEYHIFRHLLPNYTKDVFQLGVQKGINNIGFYGINLGNLVEETYHTMYNDSFNPTYPDYNRSELYKQSIFEMISKYSSIDLRGIYKNTTNTIGTNYISYSKGIYAYDTRVNASIIPSSSSVTVNIITWNATDDYYKKFNASGGNFTLTAGDFPRNARIQIKLNGTNSAIANTNSTGYFTWNYNGSSAETQFEFNVISTGVGDGSISYPAVAIAGVLGVTASVAIYTIWRRRNGGRMYGFIPFL